MSTKPRLFWKLFGALFALSLVVLVSLAALIAYGHERFVVQEQQQHLEIMARLAADEVAPVLSPGQETNLHITVARLDQRSGARVTVIRGDGTVLADSRREAAALESHADRPEVSQARAGDIGHARRYSTSTGMRMLYVAAPMADQGTVIRLALPDQALQSLVEALHRRVAQLVLVLLGVALVMAAWLSRQLSRPLLAMRQVACDLAEGRTGTVDWPQPDTRETAELAEALRRMSHRLREKIADVEQLLVEQKAVYASMVDGVLLVDRAGRVVELNRAAAQWFGCDPTAVRGRDILEVARHPRLDELVRRTLASPGPVEGDLVWHGPRDIHLQVHGAPVQPGPGRVAAVLVLTDVTRLRDMEKAHRDFVANASHELRTPVTAIKGFAENLAGDDLGPEQVKKFAGIVARQSDHLTTLIEDLLELTRLEHQREDGVLERENIAVSSVLWAAVETCALEAQEKGMAISVKCAEELMADINVPLIQRAVTNLVDNAIKYSPPHTAIEVSGALAPEGITLSVRDHGPGIAAEHRERIFERFYRVDKSRSRKLGGTGLGLSIVRHAADMHGGTVSVQSVVGEGSVFTLVLPPAAAP